MLMDIEAAHDAETIAKLKKEKHDLKFEIRQLRQRVDILEQDLINANKTINNILATQLEEMRVITVLTNAVAKLVKEKEDKDANH